MDNFFSSLTGKKVSGNMHRSNVMSQLNWVVGFLETLLGVICYFSTELWMQVGFFFIFVMILIVYFAIFIYFSIVDPSRLQSEEYNLEYHALNVMYKDGSDRKNQIEMPQKDIPTITESSMAINIGEKSDDSTY